MAISPTVWKKAKEFFEAGMSLGRIQKELGISKSQLSKKSKAQNWAKDGAIKYCLDSSIYIIKAGASNKYKIGVANDVGHRVRNLQTAHYEDLIVIRSFYIKNAYGMEKKIHKMFKECQKHIRGEWFILDEEDIKTIEGFIYGTL